MKILVDMDNCVADLDKVLEGRLCDSGANILPHDQRKHFLLQDEYPDWADTVVKTMCEPGIFAKLEPIPGAVEAVNEMVALGHHVWFCTALVDIGACYLSDKFDWLVQVFGREYASRLIITPDKTMIMADVLVDDNPLIDGLYHPSWRHVIFHQSYNSHLVQTPRLDDWANWKKVILPLAHK